MANVSAQCELWVLSFIVHSWCTKKGKNYKNPSLNDLVHTHHYFSLILISHRQLAPTQNKHFTSRPWRPHHHQLITRPRNMYYKIRLAPYIGDILINNMCKFQGKGVFFCLLNKIFVNTRCGINPCHPSPSISASSATCPTATFTPSDPRILSYTSTAGGGWKRKVRC